jgi:hypothetical protein
MRQHKLVQIWRELAVTALLVGLVLGTCIGVAEGAYVLLSENVVGRYNELVGWAIVVDASAMVGVELVLALLNGPILYLRHIAPVPRKLVSLFLGESAFLMILASGMWSRGIADPMVFARDPLGAVLQSAVVGLILGAVVLAASMWITERALFFRRARVRYWLAFEAVVIVVAILFGFSR